jgi:hypothetical protein
VVMFQVKVFWVVTPCSVIPQHNITRHHSPEDLDVTRFFDKYLEICVGIVAGGGGDHYVSNMCLIEIAPLVPFR